MPSKSFLNTTTLQSLPWKKIRRFIPEKIKVHYHVYSKDEIQKLLQVADFRERAIILILESSGMRVSGLLGLLVKDFEVLLQENNIGKLTVYARTDSYYHTFCTPECTAAIQFYLKWREEQGEIIKPTSPLIRDSIRKGLEGRGAAPNTSMPRALSRSRLWEIMSLLISKANLKQEEERKNIQPDHSFRKFMNTAIANAKANPLFKEIMMGHSVKLDNVYYDRDNPESVTTLLEEYLKAVDLLTFNDEYRLKKEIKELKQELSKAAPSDMIYDLAKENKDLRQQMVEMQKNFQLILQKIDVSKLQWSESSVLSTVR
jgi:integrase